MKLNPSRTQLEREMRSAADPVRAAFLAGYFKTGKGEYGEGDKLLGITVPIRRKISRRFRTLPLPEVQIVLKSAIHEHRAAALDILVLQYRQGDAKQRDAIVKFYLANTRYINNWDLVDASCRAILGEYLKTPSRAILDKLARSKNIWERRIAIISTMSFISAGDLDDAFRLSEALLNDKHDLMHKAVGWVLREAGRVDRQRLLLFLEENYARVPRTTLRYAIEHLPLEQRKKILAGDFEP
ncbi:MAG TPA: DNA alkylation repair protein [Silvibacterium sp.]|nr:DNA alkylation repair protein [Silvibacterium sp.]